MPTPVQKALFPVYFSHSDIVVKDQTGSGKTMGLCICAMAKALPNLVPHNLAGTMSEDQFNFVKRRLQKPFISTLFIVPTRELALQIHSWIESLKGDDEFPTIETVFRGEDQANRISNNIPNILIGTPNRLLELYQEKIVDFSRLQTLVVDEIDRIIPPLGRYADVKKKFNRSVHPLPGEILIDAIVKERQLTSSRKSTNRQITDPAKSRKLQVVVSSATVNNRLRKFLDHKQWTKEPVVLDLNSTAPATITHMCYYLDEHGACLPVNPAIKEISYENQNHSISIFEDIELLSETIASIYHRHGAKKALVFTPASYSVSELVNCLNNVGIKADRLYNMHNFKNSLKVSKPFLPYLNGDVDVICATEFEARGLDVPHIDHVFMIGLTTPQSYLHVSGRTGRNSNTGTSITLLPSPLQIPKYENMMNQLKLEMKVLKND